MVPANAPNMNPTVTLIHTNVYNIFSLYYAIILPNNVMTYLKKMYISGHIPYVLHHHSKYITPLLKKQLSVNIKM